MSYFAAGPRLVSASKVRVGVGQKEGQATRPLIGILKELQEKRMREDPFGDRLLRIRALSVEDQASITGTELYENGDGLVVAHR